MVILYFSFRENEPLCMSLTSECTVTSSKSTTLDWDKGLSPSERQGTELELEPDEKACAASSSEAREEQGPEVVRKRETETPVNSDNGRDCEMGCEETQSHTNTSVQPVHEKTTIINSLTSKPQHPSSQNHLQSLTLPPALAPKLSSVDDFLFESDDALTVEIPGSPRVMSGVKQLQQKFVQHIKSSEPKLKNPTQQKQWQGSEEDGGSGSKVAPLVPEEVMSQLMGKPG